MNLVKIATTCAVECERQKVGIRELGFLLEAYSYTQQRASFNEPITVSFFEILGSFVEPGKNRNGFRRLPVTFANGGSSAPASEIPRLMETLVNTINNRDEIVSQWGHTADSFASSVTQEFLWIHPFADGNGRISFLLLNYLLGTLNDPVPLPDFGW